MTKRIILVAVFFVSGFSAYAQEMYLSVSGSSVSVESGDNRHQYDIWIKPDAGAVNGSLQIFDAGLGGAVDLIANENANTVTTFQLLNFDDIYRPEKNTVVTVSNTANPVTELITKNEERFKNRWVPLSDITASENGYLVRVTADAGDDLNSFNFRVVDSNGRVLSGNSWKIIAIDLSIGIYRSTKNSKFQLKPYIAENVTETPDLILNGEEDSGVYKIDSFGELYDVSDSQIPASRFGTQNNWGLQIDGSEQWLNTLTVYGFERPALWVFEPIALSQLEKPPLQIGEFEATQCTDKNFELSGSLFSQSDLNNARWLRGGNPIASGGRPTISFTDRGQIPVDILIPNDRSYFPEFWPYNKVVFVNTPPVAQLDVPKQIISPSESVTLSAGESYDAEGQQISYTWLVNGTRRGIGPAFSFSNTISGVYTIAVQVSDGGGNVQCSIAEQETQIRVNTQPYAEIDVEPVSGTDEPIRLTVVNQSDSDNDNLTYLWEGIGIPPNSTSETVTVEHAQPGVYPVRLTINDGSGAQNASYSINRVYEVNAAPIPEFTVPNEVAPADVFPLNAVESADPNQDGLYYNWFVNGNLVAESDVSTLSLDEPGDYEIKLVIDDQRGASNSVQELIKTVHVNAPPQPVITAVDVTSTSKVNFSATESSDDETEIAVYNWNFGDGNSATGPQVEHLYQETGNYTVTLTVNDGSGLANSVQTTAKQLVVNSFPVADFEAPQVVAPGEAFSVNGTTSSDSDGSISKYEWFANGAPVGTGATTSITLDNTGLHTVSLSVTDDSGFEEATGFLSKQIRVNQPPVARWRTEPVELIPETEIKFIADKSFDRDGTIERYIWKFEDGTEIRGQQIQRIFSEGGVKRFTLSVTDNDGLSNSTTVLNGSVNVNHQPYIVTENIVRSNSLDVRLDASESYDLDNDALNFEWTLPDGSKRREASFSWKAPEPGVHILGLTVRDGLELANSENTESIRVLVNRPVQAVVDSVISSCTGQTVLFNSSRSYDPDGDAFKANWEFGNGTTSDEANPSYVYETPGVYEAKLTLDDGFSRQPSIAKIPVIIEGSPVAKFNISDTTICVNSALQFDGSQSTDPSGSLPSFSWDLGDGNSAQGTRYRHIFTEPGNYTVTLTVEGSGSGQCSNVSQATANITVIEGPVASFELPEWTAPGEPVILDGSASQAEGGFKSATWLIDTENSSEELSGLTTTHTFTEPGEYFITLNLETNTETDCNTVSLTKTIKVNARPEIVWELPQNVPAGTDLKLDALESSDSDGFIRKYVWQLDDRPISNNASELVKTVTPGRHKVSLKVTDNSAASNNTVSMEKYFFANSSPKPAIEAPLIVYQNQEVRLRSMITQDADGDLLTNRWKLNGAPLETPVFTASDTKSYAVTLIQDDGRSLSNSTDSTIIIINPVKIPAVSPSYPEQIVVGGVLSIDDLGISNRWTFANQNYFESTWRASAPGEAEFTLAWAPQGRALSRKSFKINVAEQLKFTEAATPVMLTWNPANPTATLKAPAVNRQPSEVEYTWKQGGEVIGKGLQINTRLIRGQNRFTIEVRDLKVAQSRPVSVDLIVTTQ